MGSLGFILTVFAIVISPIVFIISGLILIFRKELSAKTKNLLTPLLWLSSIPPLILTALMDKVSFKLLYIIPLIGALSIVILNKESFRAYRKYYGGLLILSAIIGAIVYFLSIYARFQ